MVQDFAEAHLIKRLVDRIETAMHPLHWSGGWPHRCKRIEMGTGFSKPEDCTCGLDPLLKEAKDYIGDGTPIKAPNYKPPPTRTRRGR
jgi:hypothetical protein